jgi:WhiB family redox-sensing transcriptional regulator
MTKAAPIPEWFEHADCATVGGDVWFPEPERKTTAAAKAICRGCPSVAECLAYALADPSLVGIWGATTPGERRRMRRTTPAQPVAATPRYRPPGGLDLRYAQNEHGTARGLAMHRRLGTKPCKACIEAGEVAA